jgi:CMP-N,N'-diacetyllegionaminic acid synthase
MVKILCIIPARSGSKGVPDKNIRSLKGKPLIAHTIGQGLASKYNSSMRVVVSTDSLKYAKIAISHGAEAPFLRPACISQDLSTDFEFIQHALQWFEGEQNYCPDIVLHLRPTSPFRKVETIDKCLDLFLKHMDKYDSLRTVVKSQKSPYKMYTIRDNTLLPLFNIVEDIEEPFNQCRQVLPTTYLHNGYIDIIKTSTILQYNSISGEKIYPFIMPTDEVIDIDTEEDWLNAVNWGL